MFTHPPSSSVRRPRVALTPNGHAPTAAALPLSTYFRDINQTALLSAEEEQDLAFGIGEGDGAARDHMVRANLRLVVRIARQYLGKGVGLEDLIAEGNLGLLRAVEAFDPAMGTRFSTYASFWIKQSIHRALVNTATDVRLPAYANELLVKWRRMTARLQEEWGRLPTQEEVAAGLKLSRRKFEIVKKALRISQAGLQNEEEASLAEQLGDDRTQAPDAQMLGAEELRQVLELVDRLEWRDAAVLRLRFGLDGGEPRTLREIGDQLGLTRERVRQVETEALARLREALEAA